MVRIGRPPGSRVRNIDDSVFDEVSEASAYWAGFLMADGSIKITGPGAAYITIGLQTGDVGHLEKFRDFLKSDYPIAHYRQRASNGGFTESVRITISSRRIADALAGFGVTPKKTRTAQAIGLEWNRHFWRGVIDGDGTVGLYPCDGVIHPVLKLVGSRPLMGQFAAFVAYYADSPDQVARPVRSIFKVDVAGNRAKRMVEFLYGDCDTYLDRKMSSAKSIMEFIQMGVPSGNAKRKVEEAIRLGLHLSCTPAELAYRAEVSLPSYYRLRKLFL